MEHGKVRFGFEYFENIGRLFDHLRGISKDKRHYFEWILKDRVRKPYFDIDLSCSLDQVESFEVEIDGFFASFMDALLLLGEEYGVEFDLARDVLIFESNGPKGDLYKFSYHIIINNWCLKDAAQSLEFARLVQIYMTESGAGEWAERIDMGVYSNGRAFRLLMNSKIGSDRILVFLENWRCGNKLITSYYSDMGLSIVEKTRRVFSASVITLTANCKPFPEFELPERREFAAEDVDDDDVAAALELFRSDPDTSSDSFAYKMTKGSLILLNRTTPSFCRFCSDLSGKPQVHEGENAYIGIFDRNVYFVCRRTRDYSHNKKLHNHFLGELEPLEGDEPQDTEEHSSGNGENANNAAKSGDTDVKNGADADTDSKENAGGNEGLVPENKTISVKDRGNSTSSSETSECSSDTKESLDKRSISLEKPPQVGTKNASKMKTVSESKNPLEEESSKLVSKVKLFEKSEREKINANLSDFFSDVPSFCERAYSIKR